MKIVKSEVKTLTYALRAYNHTLRQRILALLEKNGEMPVTDIFIALRLEQSVASQHLGVLRRADLVETTRTGKYVKYRLRKSSISQLKNLADHWHNNTEPHRSQRIVGSGMDLAAM